MRIIPGFLFFVLATAAITAERIDSLPEVLAQHQKALGEPLRSVQLDLSITEPTLDVTARYLASRASGMRIDVYADGIHVFSEGLDENGGWRLSANDSDKKPINEDGERALRHGLVGNLYGLHERRALGYKLSYDGHRTLDNKPYWRVSSVAPDGYTEIFFINARTGLIDRKQEVSALHPDRETGVRETVTYFSNYQWLGKHRLSLALEKRDVTSGQLLQQVTVTRAEANPRLPETAFAALHP